MGENQVVENSSEVVSEVVSENQVVENQKETFDDFKNQLVELISAEGLQSKDLATSLNCKIEKVRRAVKILTTENVIERLPVEGKQKRFIYKKKS